MKKQINFSWPVRLSDFSVDEVQGNFSRGKLKVFYKGETADHRFFSDKFAEEVILTLPYTPIVSYYDTEKDDFVGHATEQQILGIVDPCVEPTFEQDDKGYTWCVCDTVLYTERPDTVGKLAKKIEGHSQSLELDPNSVKYVINYDEKKHFKNIEFTAGKFVGVSVLGKDQEPAFTGSAFFAADQIAEKLKLISDYCESQHRDPAQNGGKIMNFNEFMKLTWGDICEKVMDAVWAEYSNDAYPCLVDMYDDSVVVRCYYYVGEKKLLKINYSVDEQGVVTLGNVAEVYITYQEVETSPADTKASPSMSSTDIPQVGDPSEEEAMNNSDANENETSVTQMEEATVTETGVETQSEVQLNEQSDVNTITTDVDSEQPTEFTSEEGPVSTDETSVQPEDFASNGENGSDDLTQDDNVMQTNDNTPVQKVSADNENTDNQEDPSAASFTESERAELEALKREKKIALVNSYKEDIAEEDFNKFMSQVDSFEEKDLEYELLKAYKANANNKNLKPMRAFSLPEVKNSVKEDTLDAFVRKNL